MPHSRSPTTPLAALAMVAALAVPARAQSAPEEERTLAGPSEVRDEQLFAQPRLTLPPVSPHVNRDGEWTLRIAALSSSSFAWWQDVPGELPASRHLLIDGEALTIDARLRRGLGHGVDLGIRLPVRARGGGRLDGLIDGWHSFWHLPDDHRPEFQRDAFRVEGIARDQQPFSWSHRAGWGLGDIELESRWRLRDGGGDDASLAIVTRLSLPTGSGPFHGNGVGAGGQLALASPLHPRLWIYTGLGGTVQGRGPVAGVEYARERVHAFLALDWWPWRRIGLVAETDAASRLVTGIAGYPGIHWGVSLTGRFYLGARTRLDLGFTENIMDQRATTDFGLHLALVVRP